MRLSLTDIVMQYRPDYNNRPTNVISFTTVVGCSSDLLTVRLCAFYFVRLIGKLTVFFSASGVLLVKSNQFHYRRTTFSSQIKSKVGNILSKASALCVNLNIDGATIVSRSHTHPSHSQTSHLLTSSVFLGVPVPHTG